ncbi:MAG: tetratricopeptide repeat-containing serine protease family protein [Acidobacteriota bacterium]|nr:tetratricopeptide repeat-containing serine protease family protein [Acidobacteriota bacterium]
MLILTYDEDGKVKAQGSGFFISKNGDIITNRHVVEDASKAEIKIGEGKVYAITGIVAEDEEYDLIRASVDIAPELVNPIQLSYSIPEVGERVIVIGSPLGLEKTVSDGIVSAVREIPRFGKIIQITAPLSPGSSGSPVVNLKGEVIGIATFQILEGQNLNFAVPSERITKLELAKEKTLAEWKSSRRKEWLASAGGLYYTGLLHLWTEDIEKALIYFQKAVEKDPNYADAYFQIGYCYGQLKQYNDAIKAYKQAIRIKPDYAEAHCGLGAAYGNLGRSSEAIESLKQAIRIKPDYAAAHCNLGLAYGNLGRRSEAIESYKQAIRIKPDHAEAHCELGAAYGNLGRHSEAIESCKQAIRIKPDYAAAHYNLGLAYIITGDKSSALDEYKILKEINQELANKLFNLIYK